MTAIDCPWTFDAWRPARPVDLSNATPAAAAQPPANPSWPARVEQAEQALAEAERAEILAAHRVMFGT